MGDIVEHVARAICVAGGIDPNEPTFASGSVSSAGSKVTVYERRFNRQEASARAAIRATLEYLRENVSAEMIERSLGWREYDIPDHWPDEARVPYGIFRAMLSAALNDIERTG